MRKTLALALMLCALALLTGCGYSTSLGNRSFVLVMSLDAVGDGQLRIAVQISAGTRLLDESGSQRQDSASGTPDNPSVQQGDYYLVSAVGSNYPQALALLAATIPRKLDFSHLRQVVISEQLARSEALPGLLRDVLVTRSVRPSAMLIVAQNDARYFVSLQRPYLGARLSEYLDLRVANAKYYGFIHEATLGHTWESMHAGRGDTLVSYVAADNFEVPRALTPGRILDDLPGHLPRNSINHTEYLGAALLNDQRMVGTVTGFGASMTHILRGSAREIFYLLNDHFYTLTQRSPARHNVTRQGAQTTLHVDVWLAATPSQTLSSSQLPELQAALTKDLREQLLFYQSLRCDPIGFGRYATRFSPTLQAWEAYDWRSAYADAALDVTVHIELSNAI